MEETKYDINTYFDKIYVINLPRRTDRKTNIERRLKKHNITNYIIFPATDGSKSLMYKHYLTVKGFTDSAGAFGVLSSAARLIHDAAKHRYQRILILEDDAVFHNNFDTQFNKRIKKIPQDWKLLYFGTSMRKWRIKERGQHQQKKHYLTSQGTIAGAFALGVDASIFPDLLMDLNTTNKPWDIGPLRTINVKYNSKCIVLYPYLILCDTRDSDIRRNKSLQEKNQTCGWNIEDFNYDE
jgi:GR25 family glycosyltransferase involved in LPS biosynthesis